MEFYYMDGYQKFAVSRMSPEDRQRYYENNRREYEQELEATKRRQAIIAKSEEIDVSKITIDDLAAIDKDTNLDNKQAVLWAVGRYLQHDVKDFTEEGKIDLLKKFIEVCHPDGERPNLDFTPNISMYYAFLLSIENIKDAEVAQLLKIRPSFEYSLFIKYPGAYSKEDAQKVVCQLINECYEHSVDQKFPEVKEAYLRHFGDDFDQIHSNIDEKSVCMIDAIKHTIINRPTSLDFILVDIREGCPEYIQQLLPFLATRVGYKEIVTCLVSDKNKEFLLPQIQKACAGQIKKEQQMIDEFFKKHGNLNYVFLELDTYADLTVEYSSRKNKEKYPDLYELSKNPNFSSLVRAEYITNKPSKTFLLLNKERIKSAKDRPVVIYAPDNLVGRIIGKGGENIKEISQKLGGVRLKVVKASERPNNMENTSNGKNNIFIQQAFWDKGRK